MNSENSSCHTIQNKSHQASPPWSPVFSRRTLSVPEIIMRKHALVQQRSRSDSSSDSESISTLLPLERKPVIPAHQSRHRGYIRDRPSGSDGDLSERHPRRHDSVLRSALLRSFWSRRLKPTSSTEVMCAPQTSSSYASRQWSPTRVKQNLPMQNIRNEVHYIRSDVNENIPKRNLDLTSINNNESNNNNKTTEFKIAITTTVNTGKSASVWESPESSNNNNNDSTVVSSSVKDTGWSETPDYPCSFVTTAKTPSSAEGTTTTDSSEPKSVSSGSDSYRENNSDSVNTNLVSSDDQTIKYNSLGRSDLNKNNCAVGFPAAHHRNQTVYTVSEMSLGIPKFTNISSHQLPPVNNTTDVECQTTQDNPSNIPRVDSTMLNEFCSRCHNEPMTSRTACSKVEQEDVKNTQNFKCHTKDEINFSEGYDIDEAGNVNTVLTGSNYRNVTEESELLVPRYSALPRTSSMEVGVSSCEAGTEESECCSLVDSLDDPNSRPHSGRQSTTDYARKSPEDFEGKVPLKKSFSSEVNASMLNRFFESQRPQHQENLTINYKGVQTVEQSQKPANVKNVTYEEKTTNTSCDVSSQTKPYENIRKEEHVCDQNLYQNNENTTMKSNEDYFDVDRRDNLMKSNINKHDCKPVRGEIKLSTPPTHELVVPVERKGSAFYVPIENQQPVNDENAVKKLLVSDHMPKHLKDRIHKRQVEIERHKNCRRYKYGDISKQDHKIDKNDGLEKTKLNKSSSVNYDNNDAILYENKSMPVKLKNTREAKLRKEKLLRDVGSLETYRIDSKGKMKLVVKDNSNLKPLATNIDRHVLNRKSKLAHFPLQTKSRNHSTFRQNNNLASFKSRRQVSLPEENDFNFKYEKTSNLKFVKNTEDNDNNTSVPRRIYQKTEINDRGRKIEILEIVECNNENKVYDQEKQKWSNSLPFKSRIPIPINTPKEKNDDDDESVICENEKKTQTEPTEESLKVRLDQKPQNIIRAVHPLEDEPTNPSIDRLIAGILIGNLQNDSAMKTPHYPEKSEKQFPNANTSKDDFVSSQPTRLSTLHRRINQFEVIPEERSTSLDSSAEDMRTNEEKPTEVKDANSDKSFLNNLCDNIVMKAINQLDALQLKNRDKYVETELGIYTKFKTDDKVVSSKQSLLDESNNNTLVLPKSKINECTQTNVVETKEKTETIKKLEESNARKAMSVKAKAKTSESTQTSLHDMVCKPVADKLETIYNSTAKLQKRNEAFRKIEKETDKKLLIPEVKTKKIEKVTAQTQTNVLDQKNNNTDKLHTSVPEIKTRDIGIEYSQSDFKFNRDKDDFKFPNQKESKSTMYLNTPTESDKKRKRSIEIQTENIKDNVSNKNHPTNNEDFEQFCNQGTQTFLDNDDRKSKPQYINTVMTAHEIKHTQKNETSKGKAALQSPEENGAMLSSVPKGWASFYFLRNVHTPPNETDIFKGHRKIKTEHRKHKHRYDNLCIMNDNDVMDYKRAERSMIDDQINRTSIEEAIKLRMRSQKEDQKHNFKTFNTNKPKEDNHIEYDGGWSSSDGEEKGKETKLKHPPAIIESKFNREIVENKFNKESQKEENVLRRSDSNSRGWSVTVSGTNTSGLPGPDLKMRLRFPYPSSAVIRQQSESRCDEEYSHRQALLPPDTDDGDSNRQRFQYLPNLQKSRSEVKPIKVLKNETRYDVQRNNTRRARETIEGTSVALPDINSAH